MLNPKFQRHRQLMGLEVLYLLIPATLLLALISLGLFFWAIRSGQFDDLDTPAIRMLFDDGTSTANSGPASTEEETPHADGAHSLSEG